MTNTAFVYLLVMIGLGGLDAIMYWTYGLNGTMSAFMGLTMYHSPLFTFMCGGLFGHFMCNMTLVIHKRESEKNQGITLDTREEIEYNGKKSQ